MLVVGEGSNMSKEMQMDLLLLLDVKGPPSVLWQALSVSKTN